MVDEFAAGRESMFTNNNYMEEDKAINPTLKEETEQSSGHEIDKVVEAQPNEGDEFRTQVEAIKKSPWFVESREQVLTDVFQEMSNLH